MEYVDIGCRFAIASVFIASAITKLGTAPFAAFVRSMRKMAVVPRAVERPTAYLVVGAEIAIPLLLAVPTRITGTAGFGVGFALLGAFIIGIGSSLRHGDRTPCRCFGKSTVPLGPRHIGRNLGLMALCLAGGIATLSTPAAMDWGLFGVAAVAGLVVGGLVIVFDDIAELFWPTPSHTVTKV